MKKQTNHFTLVLCLFFFLLFESVRAQVPTVQDCLGAIPLCEDSIYMAQAFSGEGNYPYEITFPISCLQSGEKNDVWYIFVIQQAGIINFSIYPLNTSDDYDWAIFDLTNHECGDIATHPIQVSCNYAGNSGNNGITGANGGPTTQSSPVFSVPAGNTYVLNISNYAATQSGYVLDFSASSALLYDTTAPYIDSTTTLLTFGDSLIFVRFSENIYCNSVQTTDFIFSGPGGPFTVSSVNGPTCSIGAPYGKEFVLVISPPISLAGAYTLSLVDTVYDFCSHAPLIPTNKNMATCESASTLNPVACISYTSPSGQFTWTSSGIYTDTIPNASGCDSIITIQLTIPVINTAVTQNGNILTANASGAIYQWLDCTNGFSPLAGDTANSYTATANGQYAVSITQYGCSDTSACFTVSGVGIRETNLTSNFEMFPNPATGHITLVVSRNDLKSQVTITGLTGKIIQTTTTDFHSDNKIEIKIRDLAEGMYLVQVKTRDFIETKKLIVIRKPF